MKFYKAVHVRLDDGKLCSTFAPGEWTVEYVEGQWARPDIGKLFVYQADDISDMYLFPEFSGNDRAELWEVEIEGVPYPVDLSGCSVIWIGNWLNVWGEGGYNYDEHSNTCCVDAVKLIRRVATNYYGVIRVTND